MPNPLYDALFAPHAGSDRIFLHLVEGDGLTYGDFVGQAARMAGVLTAAGLRPGDRLAAQVEKSPQALALYAACVQAGVVFLPLNTGYTVEELSYFVTDSGAGAIVCDAAVRASLSDLARETGARLLTLNADGSGSLTDQAAVQPGGYEPVERAGHDLAALLYTSGTTGRSKGAMLSHDNLLSNAATLAELWHFTAGDVQVHALPIFHTHGLFVATNIALATGGSMIFLPRFDVETVIDCLPRATAMMGVPTFYTRLLDDPRFDRDLTANVRLFVSGSAPMLTETHARMEARTGHRILERYGMTETNMNTSNPYDGERRAGTVGRPLPDVELRIVDRETGGTVAPGEIGVIEVRGPNVFQGYWNMPDKTAEEMRPDGYFVTGDLGQTDSDGYVRIVGRDKDLIISGGYNIYPKEIETVLDDRPGVLESAVIGVPDADLGEVPLALIVPVAGTPPDLADLEDALARHLARFKRPRRLVMIDALPRNTMGKVQKAALRALHAKGTDH